MQMLGLLPTKVAGAAAVVAAATVYIMLCSTLQSQLLLTYSRQGPMQGQAAARAAQRMTLVLRAALAVLTLLKSRRHPLQPCRACTRQASLLLRWLRTCRRRSWPTALLL
jgi:hypothetical protein